MRPEYDFSGGVRGKYDERYAQGTNVVRLDPDVAEVFPSSEAVNSALRALAGIIREQQQVQIRPARELRGFLRGMSTDLQRDAGRL
jgi:hypothetical protein